MALDDDLDQDGFVLADDCNDNEILDVCEIDPAGGAPGGPCDATDECSVGVCVVILLVSSRMSHGFVEAVVVGVNAAGSGVGPFD